MNKTIKDYLKTNNKKILTDKIVESQKLKDSNFFVSLNKDSNFKMIDGPLTGVPFFEKDNISTKGILTTAGTNILKNYIPPFDATVHKELIDNGAVLVGKATLDELGMGGTGLFAANGIVHNFYDKKRIIGGSSSGSAFAVSSGIVPFATGTDTGDSIRKPASYAGIVGFKPTYGSISRYGVIPYAPSLDTVGLFANNVEDVSYVSKLIFKQDLNDFTSISNELKFENLDFTKKASIAYIKEVYDWMPNDVKEKYNLLNEKLKEVGHKINFISFDTELLFLIQELYMIISYCEASSTHANLDGINFGARINGKDYREIMSKSRGMGFGRVVKRRFVIGSYNLKKENQEKLFLKAKKIRRILNDKIQKIYAKNDFLILPPAVDIAPLISDVLNKDIVTVVDEKQNALDTILVLANFNGMPSITLPFYKKNNLPIGININANIREDSELLIFSQYLENILKGFYE
ncbi:amidase family protein [Spiroplasma endosymbiont of Crioceris asparagi]|uniref:amidase family protein n=1 Tax=Spiroplasma endosymbiont of Crioceris asparagi TaxID=3066286 RepID=UPI0030CFAC25